MSYQKEKPMNLEDGRELLKVLDGKKANADSMFLYKSAFPGSVAEVEDAVAECVKQMQIEIAPVQDLHGYGKPWVGGAGKNKWLGGATSPLQTLNVTYDSGTGEYTIDGTTSNQAVFCTVYYPTSLPAGQYTISGNNSMTNENIIIRAEYSNGNVVGGGTTGNLILSSQNATVTVTATDPIAKVTIRVNSNSTISNFKFKPQIESGSTATSYEPYSNICPISGHTGCEIVRSGKNLLSGVESGNYTGTGGKTDTTTRARCVDYIPVREYSEYTINAKPGNTAKTLQIYVNYHSEKGVNRISTTSWVDVPYTFTPPTETKYILIGFRYSDNSNIAASEVLDAQIEVGTKATQYTPFVGDSVFYNVQFPSPTPGTVYGGTLTLNQDGTGTLVVDRVSVKFSDADWTSSESGGVVSYKYVATGKKAGYENVISSAYRTGAQGDSGEGTITGRLSTVNVFIVDSRFNSTEDWLADVGNETLVYELATAVSYTLSIDQVRLLLGYNTLYASTGSILSMLYPTSQVEAVANAKADGILETSSTPSAVMSFSDGADGIPMGVEVAIEPVQDLHGYDHPWVGGAGKNLFDPNSISKQWVSTTGAITENDETKTVKFSVTAGQTYTLSNKNDSTSDNVLMIAYLNSNNERVARAAVATGAKYITLQAPNDAAYIIAGFFKYSYANEPQLELGSSATTYEPYSNICPISGFDHAEVTRTGKNLFDVSKPLVVGYYINADGDIASNGVYSYSEYYTPVKPSTHYVFSGDIAAHTSGLRNTIAFYDEDKQFLSRYVPSSDNTPASFDTPANCWFIRFNASQYANQKTNIQLEEGSTATAYEPFGNTYSITFPTSAGTVYGGTLKVNKDGSGVLVVDRASVLSSSLTWNAGDNNTFYTYVSGKAAGKTNLFSNRYKISSNVDQIANMDDFSIRGHASNTVVYLRNSNYSSVSQIEESEANLQIVYSLATVLTYNIPAPIIKSLLGQNNLWASTGNVNSAEWSADTKSYIDNLFSSITSAEGQTF